MKVFVKIINLNGVKNIYADDNSGACTINMHPVKYNGRDFVAKLSAVTCGWEPEYINNSVLDGTEYRIKLVNNQGKEKVIICKNKYPSNFDAFTKVISEVLKLWN